MRSAEVRVHGTGEVSILHRAGAVDVERAREDAYSPERRRVMLRFLAQNWWVFALHGALAILFGLAALLYPGQTLGVLVGLFGGYALVDGCLSLLRTFRAASLGVSWWPFLVQGLVSLGAGIVTISTPGITALALLYFIAAWAVVGGIFEVVAAVMLRKVLEGEWMLVLSGLLSVIFGVWLFAAPGEGALAVTGIIGVYALIFGGMLVGASLRMRNLSQLLGEGGRAQPA